MSREIKFRAWNPANKRVYRSWDDGSLIGFAFQELIGIRYDEAESLRDDVKLFEFMQYTGLKDKHGVEIYEGDIVSGELHRFVIEYGIAQAEGGYEHPGFYAKDTDGDHFESYHFTWDEFEVIGNIHEHPHLLTNPENQ